MVGKRRETNRQGENNRKEAKEAKTMDEGPPANIDDGGRRSVRRWRAEGGGGGEVWVEARLMDVDMDMDSEWWVVVDG